MVDRRQYHSLPWEYHSLRSKKALGSKCVMALKTKVGTFAAAFHFFPSFASRNFVGLKRVVAVFNALSDIAFCCFVAKRREWRFGRATKASCWARNQVCLENLLRGSDVDDCC